MSHDWSAGALDLHHNARAVRRAYSEAERAILDETAAAAARAQIRSWPGYAATPLHALPGIARRIGVASVHYKDEGPRFGLGSFKALGGAYAVYRLLAARVAEVTGDVPLAADLAGGRHAELTRTLTVTCATDGNHGRSVAWGAQVFGCRCVIYVHATVSAGRVAAIERYGAEVIRDAGGYDDTVRRASREAEARGWTVVSDTSWEGYTDIPRDVMYGYTVMADEALEQFPAGCAPTHVFMQGGVGGAAAAVLARIWAGTGAGRPWFAVVEPERAACLLASARAGRRVALHGDLRTVMAGLECGETSLLAYPLLERGTDVFASVEDEDALAMMRILADPADGDPAIVAGESAVAGLAGAAAMAARPEVAASIGLDADSRLLVFGTEGDTDPELYRTIVGRTADEVRAA